MEQKRFSRIIDSVFVNAPFSWLLEKDLLEPFCKYRLNPEIGIDAYSMEKWSRADFEAVAERFRENGRRITLHGPFIDLSPGSPDPAIRRVTRERIACLLSLVPVFSPVSVVCHAGYDESRYGFIKEQWYEHAASFWNDFGRRFKKAGTRLMLENVYETEPDQLLELFSRLDETCIGWCFDPGHAYAMGRAQLRDWTGALGRYLGQVHLHDNSGDTDSHLGLGKGLIPLGLVRDMILADRDRIVITLEPHTREALFDSLSYLDAEGWFA